MCERSLNGWANQLAFKFKWRKAEMEGFWSIVIELAAHSVLILSLSCSCSRDSLRLHLNWTLLLICIHNIFATEITIEKKNAQEENRESFLWSGQELFCLTLYFFFSLFSYSIFCLPACGAVAKRLIWFPCLFLISMLLFSSIPISIVMVEHRRWPAICALKQTHRIFREKQSKANVKIRNELFICTNKWNRS